MRNNDGWIRRQTRDDESRRLYEQERLVAWTAEELSSALEDCKMTRADLARSLGTSRAYVTRVLQGNANLTLRSVADLAWATKSRIAVSFEPLREGEFVSSPVTVYNFPPILVRDEKNNSESLEDIAPSTVHALSA